MKKVIIVGANLYGFSAAAYLSIQLQGTGIQIEVVDDQSKDSTAITATHPSANKAFQMMGLDLRKLVSQTEGSFNLGCSYDSWSAAGSWSFNPYTPPPKIAGFFEFQHFWLKSKLQSKVKEYHCYSLAAMAARAGKFAFPAQQHPNPLTQLSFGLNLDTQKLAQFMQTKANATGVKFPQGHVTGFIQDEQGCLSALQLDNGQMVHGDFFIDCSTHSESKLSRSLSLSWHNREVSSTVNRSASMVLLNPKNAELLPQTLLKALPNGWVKQVSHQSNTEFTFVFDGKGLSDEEVETGLLQQAVYFGAGQKHTPRVKFKTIKQGRKEFLWCKNYLSLGAMALKTRQLEFNDYSFIFNDLKTFVDLFPQQKDSFNSLEYNRLIQADHQLIDDYECLSLQQANSGDSAFWQQIKSGQLNELMKHQLALFENQGRLVELRQQLIAKHQWVAMFIGSGVEPSSYHALLNELNQGDVLPDLHAQIVQLVDNMPSHASFLQRFCRV